VFTHAAAEERDTLRRQTGIWLSLTAVVMIPVCTGSVFIAGPLRAFFETGYGPAAGYFQLLMGAVAVGLISEVFAPVLLATGHERPMARSAAAGAGRQRRTERVPHTGARSSGRGHRDDSRLGRGVPGHVAFTSAVSSGCR